MLWMDAAGHMVLACWFGLVWLFVLTVWLFGLFWLFGLTLFWLFCLVSLDSVLTGLFWLIVYFDWLCFEFVLTVLFWLFWLLVFYCLVWCWVCFDLFCCLVWFDLFVLTVCFEWFVLTSMWLLDRLKMVSNSGKGYLFSEWTSLCEY